VLSKSVNKKDDSGEAANAVAKVIEVVLNSLSNDQAGQNK
jgi:hypothetical protein